MKTEALLVLLFSLQHHASAFTTEAGSSKLSSPTRCSRSTRSTSTTTSTTALDLFGSGNKDGEKKGPGMMDQLAMFKKAQEMATKKKKLDEELQQMTFIGESSNGKVKGTFKYVPVSNPMDPNPDYEAVAFEWDEAFFASASPADLADASKSAIANAIERTNMAVAEKYATLQADLMEALGGALPKAN